MSEVFGYKHEKLSKTKEQKVLGIFPYIIDHGLLFIYKESNLYMSIECRDSENIFLFISLTNPEVNSTVYVQTVRDKCSVIDTNIFFNDYESFQAELNSFKHVGSVKGKIFKGLAILVRDILLENPDLGGEE